jgi:putative PIN family toxin of toxin-antitoxin system
VKVVLDTNVLVAALATRGMCAQLFEHVLTHHEFAADDNLIGEVERALRDKFRAPPDRVAAVVAMLRTHSVVLEPEPLDSPVCRDPDDDRILALCRAVGTDVLVTGDADLLVLHPWEGVPILAPRDFWPFERGSQ